MKLIDTHCHIDLYRDYQALIHECEEQRVVTVAVTNTPSVFPRLQSLLSGKRFLRPAIGLHPELAHTRQSELSLMKELLSETRFVGEIGLDYVTSDSQVRDIQKRVFQTILTECDRAGNKILTVHSRRAAQEVIDMIGQGFNGKVILHWYSGNTKAATLALKYGFYFSANTSMISSDAGRRLLSAIPPDRLLTESDGPFVALDHRPARPHDVERVISELGSIWKMDTSEAADIISENFKALLTTHYNAGQNIT